jgi:5-methylcytosine-specific restriction endonuclease McrA
MVIGRIKRLQSAARSQIESIKTDELSICNLCDRPIPSDLRDVHHLIPKSRGGVVTVFLHRACHKQVHALLTETELDKIYLSMDALRAHLELARFIKWIQDKPSDFNPPIRRSRNKGMF